MMIAACVTDVKTRVNGYEAGLNSFLSEQTVETISVARTLRSKTRVRRTLDI